MFSVILLCVPSIQWLCSFEVCCIIEVLQDPAVSARLSDTKAAAEVKALNDFYSMLQNDPNRAFYGFVNNFEFIYLTVCYFLLCLCHSSLFF